MIKKLVVASAVILAIALALFVYRVQILKISAETIVRSLLPSYVDVDKTSFNFNERGIVLEGFRIINPPSFSHKYLLEVGEIRCKYRMNGRTILDGLALYDVVLKRPVVDIERLSDGRLNLTEMPKVIEGSGDRGQGTGLEKASTEKKKKEKKAQAPNLLGDRKISDIIKLPEQFSFKDGKVIFVDRLNLPSPHMLTFEEIAAELSLKLNETYEKLLDMSSSGGGQVNGNREETVKWVISWNPTTPALTMSNRFEVSNVNILPFAPYYDRYSPFVFVNGTFSGTLVFDFDNGNIGSTNEVHLKDFRFYIKDGYENAELWGTTVQDLAKYFTSPYGEIIFDFKIKGAIDNPTFFLGPISKQAVASMAVDKVIGVIQSVTGPEKGEGRAQADEADKLQGYVDLFKALIKKK